MEATIRGRTMSMRIERNQCLDLAMQISFEKCEREIRCPCITSINRRYQFATMAFNEAVEVSMQLLQQVVVIHVNSLDDIVRYKAFLSRTYAFLNWFSLLHTSTPYHELVRSASARLSSVLVSLMLQKPTQIKCKLLLTKVAIPQEHCCPHQWWGTTLSCVTLIRSSHSPTSFH